MTFSPSYDMDEAFVLYTFGYPALGLCMLTCLGGLFVHRGVAQEYVFVMSSQCAVARGEFGWLCLVVQESSTIPTRHILGFCAMMLQCLGLTRRTACTS